MNRKSSDCERVTYAFVVEVDQQQKHSKNCQPETLRLRLSSRVKYWTPLLKISVPLKNVVPNRGEWLDKCNLRFAKRNSELDVLDSFNIDDQ